MEFPPHEGKRHTVNSQQRITMYIQYKRNRVITMTMRMMTMMTKNRKKLRKQMLSILENIIQNEVEMLNKEKDHAIKDF